MFCEAIEQLQREALDRPRPELVVKVDRSGLNEHHPIVRRLYTAIDRVLRPIVMAEERRAGAHLLGAPRAVTARDQVGLRALNDALKAAFDQPGTAGGQQGSSPADKAPLQAAEPGEAEEPEPGDGLQAPRATAPAPALYFKQSPVRLHPGEKRTVTLFADPDRVHPGTPVEVEADAGLTVTLRGDAIPEPGRRGLSTLAANVRARVTAEPGSRLVVLAAAGEHTCELEILIVRHRASGWVREIARKSQDQLTEADLILKPVSSLSTKGGVSSASSSAPLAAPATAKSASPNTSPTGCWKSKRPPTLSMHGQPNRSSLGGCPRSDPQIPPNTLPQPVTRPRRSGTARTTS